MKINKNSLDTLLLILIMVAPISPVIFAKKLVIIVFSLLLIRILIGRDLLYYKNIKILIFLLFLPSIIMSAFYPGDDFFRFWPVLLIVFAFPFSDFKINYFKVLFVSLCILYFLIITQFFLAYGDDYFLNFRDRWYPHARPEKFIGGFTDSIIKSMLSSNRTLRFGGLYHNPNILAGIIFMHYLIFDGLSKNLLSLFKGKKKKFLQIIRQSTFVLVVCGLFLASSRAIIVSFIFYLFFNNLDFSSLRKFKIKKISIFFIFLSFLFFLLIIESVIDGVFAERSSFRIKYSVFINYLGDVNFLDLFIGGNFGLSFDQEYGYWLASSGLIGYLAFIIFFYMMIKIVPTTKILVCIFLLIGLAATVFYNFLIISIVTSLLIVNSSLYFESIKQYEK